MQIRGFKGLPWNLLSSVFIWHRHCSCSSAGNVDLWSFKGRLKAKKRSSFFPIDTLTFPFPTVWRSDGRQWSKMVPKTFWMGALLVVAFIQSELQCIVLPNQQIRIEFAGGCQKVSSADERGFPLFTALTELPFCAGQPIISLRRSGSAAGCFLKMSNLCECKPPQW